MRVSDQECITRELVDEDGRRDILLVTSIRIERRIIVLPLCCGVRLHAWYHTVPPLFFVC